MNRATSYSLPIHIANVVHVVRNSIQILPYAIQLGRKIAEITEKDASKAFRSGFTLQDDLDATGFMHPSLLKSYYNVDSFASSSLATQQILTLNTGDVQNYLSKKDLAYFQTGTGIPSDTVDVTKNGHTTNDYCPSTVDCSEPNLDVQYMTGPFLTFDDSNAQ